MKRRRETIAQILDTCFRSRLMPGHVQAVGRIHQPSRPSVIRRNASEPYESRYSQLEPMAEDRRVSSSSLKVVVDT